MANFTPPKINLVEEFKSFLLKHGVVGLAVGVVIGGAVGKVVSSVVADVIMPIVGLLTPAGDWRTAKIWIFGVGNLFGTLLDFVIVAFVVFMIIKYFIKEPPKAAGPAMKACPDCLEQVLAQAKKCKFCGSNV
jgi:large conductance mechanosensitive channel